MSGGGVGEERGPTASDRPLVRRWRQATAVAPSERMGLAAPARATATGGARQPHVPLRRGGWGFMRGLLRGRGRGPQLQY